MADLYVDDVVEQTDISKRNVKYWCKKYDLRVEKDGRSNVYPPRTVKLLKLIKLLSDSELFNHRFIQLQVQRAQGETGSELEFESAYEKVRKEGQEMLSEIDSSSGTVILPQLSSTSSTGVVDKSHEKAGEEAGEVDEILL